MTDVDCLVDRVSVDVVAAVIVVLIDSSRDVGFGPVPEPEGGGCWRPERVIERCWLRILDSPNQFSWALDQTTQHSTT